jgi:hypothetical protein
MGRRDRRPARPPRRDGAKTVELDAVRVAREALSRDHLAAPRPVRPRSPPSPTHRPTRRGRRPHQGHRTAQGVDRQRTPSIARATMARHHRPTARPLRPAAHPASHSVEHRATVSAIRATARRTPFLEGEAAQHKTDLEQLVMNACPELLDLAGVGVITAAHFIICWWSHPGRIRSEAAFAGVAPIRPAVETPSDTDSTAAATANSTGPCTPPPIAPATPRDDEGLRRRRTAEGKSSPRHQPLPQTSHCPRDLPPPASPRPSNPAGQNGRLTAIEASSRSAQASPPRTIATGCCSPPRPSGSPG